MNHEGHICTWRKYEDSLSKLMEQTAKIDEEIRVEQKSISQLTALQVEMEKFRDSFKDFDLDVKDDEFNKFKNKINLKFHEERNKLLKTEAEMESMWMDRNFWDSFEFLLLQSILTPQPNLPIVNRQLSNKLTEIKLKSIQNLNLKTIELEKYLILLKKRGDDVMNIVDDFDVFDLIQERMEILKFSVEEKVEDSIKRKELLSLINNFQINQKRKMRMISKVNEIQYQENVKNLFEKDLNRINGRWALRLGQFINSNELKEDSKNTNEFLPEHVINATKREREEKPFFAIEAFNQKNGNNFVLLKYLKFIEESYSYFYKKNSQIPMTIYEEAIKEVLV